MAIYDTMTYIKSPVSTIAMGSAASMGAVLLAGGEPGKRYSLPHTSIMIHQPTGGTHGRVSDILIYANDIQRTREQLNRIMQYHLNKAKGFEKYTVKQVGDMMDRDYYMTAEEALELGVVDHVLTNRTPKEVEEKKAGEQGEKNNKTGEQDEKKKE